MIAHARQRLDGRGVRCRPDHVHEAAPRPERGAVEAGVQPLRPPFAIRGEGGVDQPFVVLRERFVPDPEAFARGEREVRHEHVRVADESVQHLATGFVLEIENEAALVPVVHEPAVVHVARWIARGVSKVTERVPRGGLELDYVRAEVRHHGCGGRSGDEAARVDDLETGE